jgi:hypothetical protein
VIINNIKKGKYKEGISNKSSIDFVLAVFLLNLSEFCNSKLYRVLGIFFRILRECLNEKGYLVIEKAKDDK